MQFSILWGEKRSLHSLPSLICSSDSVSLSVHGKLVNPTKKLKQFSSQSERSKAMLCIQTQTDYQVNRNPQSICAGIHHQSFFLPFKTTWHWNATHLAHPPKFSARLFGSIFGGFLCVTTTHRKYLDGCATKFFKTITVLPTSSNKLTPGNLVYEFIELSTWFSQRAEYRGRDPLRIFTCVHVMAMKIMGWGWGGGDVHIRYTCKHCRC